MLGREEEKDLVEPIYIIYFTIKTVIWIISVNNNQDNNKEASVATDAISLFPIFGMYRSIEPRVVFRLLE